MAMLFHSTRGKNVNVTAKQAIRKGIADDGGLFVTDSLGEKTVDVANLPGKSYQQIAKEVLGILLDDFSAEELDECINSAYGSNFSDSKITPLREVGDDYVLELFHGPTSAFKDIALQILPEFMARAGSENSKKACERIMILTATSGDTGKAALDGFAGTEGTGITVFYPEGKVSEVQRMQMVAQQGDNVAVCAVRGNFDDAQSSVKEIFADKTLADELLKEGFDLVSGGTDNHLMLVDLRPMGITGKEFEARLDSVHITVNKNAIPNDPEKPFVTSGVRVGTPAVTSRGLTTDDMKTIAHLFALTAKDYENSAPAVRAAVAELCKKYPLY